MFVLKWLKTWVTNHFTLRKKNLICFLYFKTRKNKTINKLSNRNKTISCFILYCTLCINTIKIKQNKAYTVYKVNFEEMLSFILTYDKKLF